MAVFTGTAAADNLVGGAENDVLQGLAGADTLDGGAGADQLIGGDDSDTYIVDNAGDQVIEAPGAAGGTDLVNTSVTYTLGGGSSVETLTATGSASINLTGNEIAQALNGNAGNNILDGGADTVSGGVVTEVLDTLAGGLGNDTYVVRNTGDVVTEAANSGVDTVLVAQFQAAAAGGTASSYTLDGAANVEVLAALTASGSESINLIGNTLAQTIQGNAGANALTGGGGADTLIGLAGNDTYNVSTATTVLIEADGAGTDVLNLNLAAASTAYTLGAGVSVETINVTSATALNVTGNAFNQAITGNGAANLLNGGGGEDSLTGGAGDDTYVVDSAGDVVVEAAAGGVDVLLTNSSFVATAAQSLEVLSVIGYVPTSTVSDQDGTLSLNGLNTTTGDLFLVGNNTVGETIIGNAGANTLDGNRLDADGVFIPASPASTLAGLGGDDIYRVYGTDDVVFEDRNGGFDRIFTSASYDLSALSGTFTAPAGTATAYYTAGQAEIELLSTANNSATTAGINLTGNGYGQIIVGNFGANIIAGGGTSLGGVDALYGLNGNDTYTVSSANTFVFESAGSAAGAADVVNVDATATSNFTLNGGSYVETLQTANAAGTEAIVLVGNEQAQNIIGNAGANTLSGGGTGVGDTLNGGAGNDTYRVFNINDTIVDSAGTDSIFASGSSYQIGDAVSVEYLSAAVQGAGDNIFLVGNELQQSIVGNYGDNTLDGNRLANGGTEATTAANSDTLIGLFGSDIYRVYGNNNDGNGGTLGAGITGDVVIEQAGNGNYDQVFASGNYQLRNDTEVEALSAANQSATTGTYTLRGNGFAQLVVGNNAANTIDGRGGNDTLTGRGGNDVFAFTTALNGTTNVDQITDFTAGDRIGLATDIFAATTFGAGDVLTAAEFTSNTTGAATTAAQRIIFNSATGQLFYDADGSGSGAATLFAQVAIGTQLGFNDFISQVAVTDLPAVA